MTKTQFTMTRKEHTLLAGSHTEELIQMECTFTHSWADDGKSVTFFNHNTNVMRSLYFQRCIAMVKSQVLGTGSFTQLKR